MYKLPAQTCLIQTCRTFIVLIIKISREINILLMEFIIDKAILNEGIKYCKTATEKFY